MDAFKDAALDSDDESNAVWPNEPFTLNYTESILADRLILHAPLERLPIGVYHPKSGLSFRSTESTSNAGMK